MELPNRTDHEKLDRSHGSFQKPFRNTPRTRTPHGTGRRRRACEYYPQYPVHIVTDRCGVRDDAHIPRSAHSCLFGVGRLRGKAFIESFESASLGVVTIDKLIVASEPEAVTFSHGSMTITMKGKKTAEVHNNPFADYWVKGAAGMWRIACEVNVESVMPDATAKK